MAVKNKNFPKLTDSRDIRPEEKETPNTRVVKKTTKSKLEDVVIEENTKVEDVEVKSKTTQKPKVTPKAKTTQKPKVEDVEAKPKTTQKAKVASKTKVGVVTKAKSKTTKKVEVKANDTELKLELNTMDSQASNFNNATDTIELTSGWVLEDLTNDSFISDTTLVESGDTIGDEDGSILHDKSVDFNFESTMTSDMDDSISDDDDDDEYFSLFTNFDDNDDNDDDGKVEDVVKESTTEKSKDIDEKSKDNFYLSMED